MGAAGRGGGEAPGMARLRPTERTHCQGSAMHGRSISSKHYGTCLRRRGAAALPVRDALARSHAVCGRPAAAGVHSLGVVGVRQAAALPAGCAGLAQQAGSRACRARHAVCAVHAVL